MLKSPERPSDAPRNVDDSPPAELGAVFSALGDAVALVDRAAQRLRWTSRDWQVLWPSLRAGSTLAELEQALPGLGAAARVAEPSTAGAPRRLSVGAAAEWEAEFAGLDPGTLLLRLADRREQSRALQRQLDDREQLLFTSRVISVGEMASTLAHELNQPIGAAANLMRGLRKRLARSSGGLAAEESEALDRAIDQVMFASRIIARIREFTHSHQPRQARVDFSSLLRSSASLLDWDLRRTGALLALEMPDAAVLVRGDAVMLQQVVVNLMRNALDALRTDPPEHPRLTLRLFAGVKEVELQVSDNGCGLADETAARMFVPFASSKPNGMGLGLSICRSFVELHRGRLWFSRHADRGVTFHLGLPPLAAGPASH
jgi:two-component system, LuxR family, sensor kinase FixL